MSKYDIAAYIWPSYTGDEPRSRMFWPEGIGEWQSVKSAGAKFEGHNWPRVPLLGYQNEADPAVMEQQIDIAVRHGVNVFIYDWYWYDRRPFLECCLNDGFLAASNNKSMKFYIMWANHDANHLWNKELSDTDVGSTVIWRGDVERSEFEKIGQRLIDKYFVLDNYYKINGCPVFMIYDTANFIRGIGGVAAAADAIRWLKAKAREAGLPGVHVQIAGRRNSHNFSGVDGGMDNVSVIRELGIDSFSHYQYAHLCDVNRDYPTVFSEIRDIWYSSESSYGIPYYPHVSCGWDNNPRFKKFIPRILSENTPANIEAALREAKRYVDEHKLDAPLITVNSWNEWTESSYLLPDDLYGYGYLEAIKRVFVDEE